MKLNELLDGLTVTPNILKYKNTEVLCGDSTVESACAVCALIVVTRATKFRATHIRFSTNLEQLVNEVRNNYPIPEDELLTSIVPIAGFTMTDLCHLLG